MKKEIEISAKSKEEAIWKIEVEDFPAFILVDDKGNDFFKQLKPCQGCTILQ